ncbi:hypothetical protein [Kordia sp.]|uniref:hypothetical protein n=1 Tax=Kordia sp. TaxID=1965332 RepID=UPI003B5CE11C
MKKQKLGLNKLSLTKSRVAELNTLNAKGGWGTESTNPFCIATGYYDDTCDVTANCSAANQCGGTNGCPSGTCPPPTQTRQIISCLEAC